MKHLNHHGRVEGAMDGFVYSTPEFSAPTGRCNIEAISAILAIKLFENQGKLRFAMLERT